jgi:nucleoside-diphosphate-sugar epimerase
MTALDASPGIDRILGMARRPFDPAALGWRKVSARRGDVLDRAAVETLCEGADVVVHLAFVIVAGSAESEHINLEGSRNVFESAVAAGAKRLVYTSSVAAYGFPALDRLITEDDTAAGNDRHPYSHHKAGVEALLDEILAGADIDAYIFRPCIVAGPQATALVDQVPYARLAQWLSDRGGAGALGAGALRALGRLPGVTPIVPDPGVPFQLVHHDDVAAALLAGVLGTGPPGAYNLAGEGEITLGDLARSLGLRAIPVPGVAVDVTAEVVARLPLLPDEASWIEALRRPTLMDTTKARKSLGWHPRHGAATTLAETVAAARARGT